MKRRQRGAGPPLALEILDYLKRHPEAKDTANGIVQWWLTEQSVRRTLVDVKAAVKDLVAKGLVVENRASDGRAYYSLNQRRPTASRRILASGRPRPVNGLAPARGVQTGDSKPE